MSMADPDNPWHDPNCSEVEDEILPHEAQIQADRLEYAREERQEEADRILWTRYAGRLTARGGLIR